MAAGKNFLKNKTEADEKKQDRIRYFLYGCIALLLLAAVGLILHAARLLPGADESPAATPAPTAGQNQALATPEDWLPQNLAIAKCPPEAVLTDEQGSPVSLRDWIAREESGVWVVFWASWCPDCNRQFEVIREMEALAETYGARLLLVDRLNREKESVEAARKKIAEYGVTAPVLYDPDEAVYSAWGMREIPSSVVLDKDGVVRAYANGTLTAGQCEGLLNRAFRGRDSAGLSFIQNSLSNGRGGVCSSTAAEGDSPTGTDVLSESQGLMLWYALIREDRALFDQTLTFVQTDMLKSGLAAWYVGEGKAGAVNASLDDLRIIQALRGAAEKWGEAPYASLAEEMGRALLNRCVNAQGSLVDWAELDGQGRAHTISLCYLDLACLRALAQEDADFAPVLANAEQVLQGGRISDAFPLYYAGYDYEAAAYSQSDLNTAEALYTLWNLSRADALPEDAWLWLRERIETGTLAARYHVDGTAVKGFEYHSTAVWGLAALIAGETGDEAAFEKALRRMDRMFVLDAGDARFGAYAQKGAAAHAFDQLIPLLANALASGGNEFRGM